MEQFQPSRRETRAREVKDSSKINSRSLLQAWNRILRSHRSAHLISNILREYTIILQLMIKKLRKKKATAKKVTRILIVPGLLRRISQMTMIRNSKIRLTMETQGENRGNSSTTIITHTTSESRLLPTLTTSNGCSMNCMPRTTFRTQSSLTCYSRWAPQWLWFSSLPHPHPRAGTPSPTNTGQCSEEGPSGYNSWTLWVPIQRIWRCKPSLSSELTRSVKSNLS